MSETKSGSRLSQSAILVVLFLIEVGLIAFVTTTIGSKI